MSVHTTGKNSLVPIYGGVLPTFTRATTATRVNAAGLIERVDSGVARITHDPVTLECRGYLAEGARTNQCLYSEDFSNAAWVKSNVTVTPNDATAPDGTTTADLLTATASNGTVIQDLGAIASAAQSGSLYLLRKTGAGNIDITLDGGATWQTVLHALNNTGEWVRFSITQTLANPDFGIRLTTSGDEVWVWGAQVEQIEPAGGGGGEFASSYIPTTTAAVTRNADLLEYPFASSFPATVYCEFRFNGLGASYYGVPVQFDDGTDNERFAIYKEIASGANRMRSYVQVAAGLANDDDITSSSVNTGTTIRCALALAANDVQGALNGTLGSQDTSCPAPTGMDTIRIGTRNGGQLPMFGTVAVLKYWAQRLTNAQLQALSNGEDIGITPDFLVDFTTTSLAEQTGSLDHARIGYLNPARDLTATASSAADDYPADAPQRPDTYESWKPATMPATWQVDFGEDVAVDYLGIAAHELGTKGCTVTVQYSADASTWYDASDAAAPTDDSPLLLLFSPQAARYWRILLEQAASPTDAPEVGVIYLGRILAMPRPIYGGHAPITLARETVLHQSLSRGGHFLGQGFRRQGFVGQASYRHLTAAWYREHFDPFVLAARRYPYFFAWRPGTFADECAYVWTDEDIRPSNMGLRDFMAVSWPMRGFAHA